MRRARQLPRPEPLSEADRAPLVARIRGVLDTAQGCGRLDLDPAAEAAWDAAYPALTADRPGLAGAMTARAEAHARRLALEYALLDGDDAIRAPHIVAALALVEYADRGVSYLFGDRLGDGVADTILDSVRRRGEVTRSEVRDIFQRHVTSSRLDGAIAGLQACGAIEVHEESTSGRPVTVLTLGATR